MSVNHKYSECECSQWIICFKINQSSSNTSGATQSDYTKKIGFKQAFV